MDPPGLLSHPVRLAGTSLLKLQTDDRLTELARAGHEPAFDAIVHRYRPALLRYCTRILGPQRAEDAVQQALASAHVAMTSGDERELQLRPWLFRIAHNAALNMLRGRRDEVELSDEQFAAALTPEHQVAQREHLEAILSAIAALPASQRDALLLREMEGRSHEEIAEVLGVSSGAARATLFRARSAIRAAFSALTPAPLLPRLAELATSGAADPGSHVATKAVAGLLAAGAVIGGGTQTGVIGHGGRHAPRADATAAEREPVSSVAASGGETTVAATPAASPPTAPTTHALRVFAPPARHVAERSGNGGARALVPAVQRGGSVLTRPVVGGASSPAAGTGVPEGGGAAWPQAVHHSAPESARQWPASGGGREALRPASATGGATTRSGAGSGSAERGRPTTSAAPGAAGPAAGRPAAGDPSADGASSGRPATTGAASADAAQTGGPAATTEGGSAVRGGSAAATAGGGGPAVGSEATPGAVSAARGGSDAAAAGGGRAVGGAASRGAVPSMPPAPWTSRAPGAPSGRIPPPVGGARDGVGGRYW